MIAVSNDEFPGTIVVVSDRVPSVVTFRDWEMKLAGRGVTPFTKRFSPGLYRVSLSYPGLPVTDAIIDITSNATTLVRFSLSANFENRQFEIHAQSPTLGKRDVVSIFAETLLSQTPLRTLPNTIPDAEQTLGFQSGQPTSSYLQDVRATIECWRVLPDGNAIPVDDFEHTVIYTREGAYIGLRLPQTSGVIIQLVIDEGLATNVSVPGGWLPHNNVVLRLKKGPSGLLASIELECEWIRVIEGCIREGRLEEARTLMAGHVRTFDDVLDVLEASGSERSTAAHCYLPYLLLRMDSDDYLRKLAELHKSKNDQIDVLCRDSPDWAVVVAEANARMGNHSEAVDLLRRLKSLGLPAYTEGYWMLVSRLRSFIAEGQDNQSSFDEATHDTDLLLTSVLRWAPYVDVSALTLTYSGSDVSRPSKQLRMPNSWTAVGARPLHREESRRHGSHDTSHTRGGSDPFEHSIAATLTPNDTVDFLSALRVLRNLVEYLANQADARTQLRQFLDLLSQGDRRFRTDEWNGIVLRSADQESWPGWAVQSLNFPNRSPSGAVVVWSPLAELLTSFGIKAERSMCSEEVYLFGSLPRSTRRELRRLSHLLDETRTAYPYLSTRGCTAEAVNLLKQDVALNSFSRYKRPAHRRDEVFRIFKRQQYRKLQLPSRA